MYKINNMSWTSNMITLTNRITVMYHCLEEFGLLKEVQDFNGNCYDETTREWKEVQLHINKLSAKKVKELLLW